MTSMKTMFSPDDLLVNLLSEEQALEKGRALGIDDYIAKMHLFRVLLNHPKVAGELNNTIIALVSGDKALSDRVRELVIMRVSWKAACEYEWSQHWYASLFFGLTETELFAVRDWQNADCFSDEEKTILAATDAVLEEGRLTPTLWESVRVYLPEDRAIIELVVAIGNWHMFAMILNALEIPLEAAMDSWPPNGVGPEQQVI